MRADVLLGGVCLERSPSGQGLQSPTISGAFCWRSGALRPICCFHVRGEHGGDRRIRVGRDLPSLNCHVCDSFPLHVCECLCVWTSKKNSDITIWPRSPSFTGSQLSCPRSTLFL